MIEPSGFREIARSATVTYPIPFAFALCFAFAVLTLGGAILADGALRWVLVGFSAFSITFAFVMFAFAALRHPELLRSERHQIVHRVLDFIGDSDRGPETLEVGRLLLEGDRTKKASSQSKGRTTRKEGRTDG